MHGLWIYVRFNALQLGSIISKEGIRASDAKQPIAIYDALNNQLCQLNQCASDYGLKQGQGLASASALCAELHIIEYDPKHEAQRLNDIAQQLYGVTADIALDKPNGLYLRADNMLKLYADLATYWQTIRSLLSHYHYDYASAYSMSAAKVLAQSQYNCVNADKHQWQKALRQCKLEHSGLTDKQIHALKRVGIRSFDDLFAQPVSALAARFDGPMLRYLSELKGERFERLPLFRPKREFHAHSELLYEITLSERLLKPLGYLLKQMERYLFQRALVTFDITVALQLRDKQTQHWQLHSAQGENRCSAWLSIATVAIEKLTLEAPVQGLTLSATQLTSAVAANDDFFIHQPSALTPLQLLTRLQARLGERSVYQLALRSDHRPEYASQRVYPCASGKTITPDLCTPLLDRPSLLLTTPQPLSEKSTILSPPERIISGWWSNATCERDYFIAQNPQGQYLWVFRDQQNHWFVHGYFV
ncbi:Y-family DNA polymerase [Alteromonas facilis]|uniref:Y-family DNA polymerase n=1 Tax=Alteromonas facilis TaxID=2048004 RepID=UPI000C28AAEA|nr:DNA polymerase Y family protein [Alteromonas facilis]